MYTTLQNTSQPEQIRNRAVLQQEMARHRINIKASGPAWASAREALMLGICLHQRDLEELFTRLIENRVLKYYFRTPGQAQGDEPLEDVILTPELISAIGQIGQAYRSSVPLSVAMADTLEHMKGLLSEIKSSYSQSQIPVWVTLTPDQATTLTQALELYEKLGVGQFDSLVWAAWSRADAVSHLARALNLFKAQLDYPDAAALEILSGNVFKSVRHAWELKKVVEQATALVRKNAEESLGLHDQDDVLGCVYEGLTKRACPEAPMPQAVVRKLNN